VVPVLRSPLLEPIAGVRHAFFTRQGGVSRGLYASLNVGLGSGDDERLVEENRRRAADHFGLSADRLFTAYQTHSADILVAGAAGKDHRPRGDGIVSNAAGRICGVLAADCAPVLLADGEAGVVAAVHAGWRGALGGVVEAAVGRMVDLGAEPRRIVAAVGPCIGPRSYEVGLEFLDRFAGEAPGSERYFSAAAAADKRLFDLPAFVLARLRAAGVDQAEWLGRDTYAEESEFFSNRRAVHRRESDYGRLLSAIVLAD
jgi:YfiH family protein